MQKAIIGKKLGMTQLFDENGSFIPVTVIEAGPCVVVTKKTAENDGYESVQLGFGEISDKHVNKPMKGQFAKSDVAAKRVLREFKLADCASVNVGDIVKADAFAAGEKVDVCGTSKGKGFAGTIKRYGNHSLKATHGSGPVGRHAGSMGACSSPSRIYKGKKMPGHMGDVNRKAINLEVVQIRPEDNAILVKGSIPGARNSVVIIRKSLKNNRIAYKAQKGAK